MYFCIRYDLLMSSSRFVRKKLRKFGKSIANRMEELESKRYIEKIMTDRPAVRAPTGKLHFQYKHSWLNI